VGTVLELLLRAQDYEGNGVADDAPPLAMLRLADEITVSAPNQRVAWKRSEQWGTSRLSPVRPVRPERTFPVLVVIPARVEGPLVAKIHAQVGHRLLIFAVGVDSRSLRCRAAKRIGTLLYRSHRSYKTEQAPGLK
jgi:hypothetical protein